MGIQENAEKQLGVPLIRILHDFKTSKEDTSSSRMVDIFDSEIFKATILKFLSPAVLSSISFKDKGGSYRAVWELLKQAAVLNDIETHNYQTPSLSFLNKKKLDFEEEIIDEETWANLRTICDLLFQIMLKNEKVLIFITGIQQKDQIAIKQYLENHCSFDRMKVQIESPTLKSHKSNLSLDLNGDQALLDRIEELQSIIANKDLEILKISNQFNETNQSFNIMRTVLQQKQIQIKNLNQRIDSYSQAEVLFEEKDQEITKFSNQLSELKLKSHVKITQLTNQVARLKQTLKQLEHERNELASMNQILNNKNESLSTNREEGDTTNKKVIINLKQKIRVLNQKIAQQQKHLMEVLTQKQQRQKQILEMEKRPGNFQNKMLMMDQSEVFKNTSGRKSSKLVDELGDLAELIDRTQKELKEYFEAIFGQDCQKCSKQMCIALRSQYIRIVQQILEINNDTQSLMYMTPSNRLECILNQLDKLADCYQQNLKLKQKIVIIQSQGKGHGNKQLIDQINKLKKKLLVMKRNIDDIEIKRKEELQVLIGAVSQSLTFDIKS